MDIRITVKYRGRRVIIDVDVFNATVISNGWLTHFPFCKGQGCCCQIWHM